MKNQPDFLLSAIRHKYHKLYTRFQKAILSGRFSRYTAKKKQQLLLRLSRYEKQLQLWGKGITMGAALLLPGYALQAQPIPLDSAIHVNTYLPGDQDDPCLAMDRNGNFVVVWESSNQDGSNEGIYAQRFNNAGIALGSEFRVNTYTTGNQRNPSVAMDSGGDFVVVWESSGQTIDIFSDIYGQRYDRTGVAKGPEFLVNTYTTDSQSQPSVAMDKNGDFVVVWNGIGLTGTSPDVSAGIYAQRYNQGGVAQGSEFRINTYTTDHQNRPTVAMDGDGDFVAVWQSYNQDGDGSGVYAQRFDNNGTAQGAEFRVNDYTTNDQRQPAVALHADGHFVITWSSVGQDAGTYPDIYARRFLSNGEADGNEFKVFTDFTVLGQVNPSVAMDEQGDFVISSAVVDGFNYNFYVRYFEMSGNAPCPEVQVNTFNNLSYSNNPKVAMNRNGEFVVAFSTFEVYAQRYSAFLPPPQPWYADTDGDGYGSGEAIIACDQPANTSTNNTDCHDGDIAVNPGAPEVCNNIDDDCDTKIDDNLTVCPVPAGLSTTSITPVSATLNWEQAPCAKKYKIRYTRLSPYLSTQFNVASTGNTIVSGLSPASTYKWHIRTKCPTRIFSSASPWQFFTTGGPLLLEAASNENTGAPASFSLDKTEISLQPNPASGHVRVLSSGKPFQQVTILDMSGRIVWQRTGLNNHDLEIDIQTFVPGLYQLHCQSEAGNCVLPLVAVR